MVRTLMSLILLTFLSGCASQRSWVPCKPTVKMERKRHDDDGASGRHQYVGFLQSPIAKCSSVLIGKNIALTASHCISPESMLGGQKTFLRFGVGTYELELIFLFPVGHPLEQVAVIGLDRDVEDVKPVKVARELHKVDDSISVVGFGPSQLCLRGDELWPIGAGVRRAQYGTGQELSPVDFTSLTLLVGPGDSGGAVIDETRGELLAIVEAIVVTTEPSFSVAKSVFTPVVGLTL